MKELTIEQKAKAYDEALERAKKLKETCDSTAVVGWCEYIIPELKESEDEKIRKAIISSIETDSSVYEQGVSKEQMIAWLEKQGKIDLEHYEDGENEKRKFVGYGFLKCKGDFLSFKEGETYWLEYIGKDNYNVRSDNLLGQTFHIKPVELYTVFRPTTWLEKQDKQNTDDKVKPKFKVGDWITYNHNPNLPPKKIIQITNEDYIFNNDSFEIKTLEAGWHLWTIQDAKDGDVLTSGQVVFIFKMIHGVWLNCYCSLHNDRSLIADSYDLLTDKYFGEVYPATKEQRDTLMKAMTDAGYTFDFEKKELKKIEQKPSWSEEDENQCINTIELVKNANDCAGILDKETALNWLKSLKERVQPQPKQEWSKEDWNYIVDLISYFDGSSLQHDTPDVISWLKSLKPRST